MNYSSYSYSYSYTTSPAVPAVAVLTIVLIAIFVTVLVYVVHAFLLSRVFKKAGVAQWIAWVPFYNVWKFLELGDQQGFWAVLSIIPFVSYVSAVFLYIAAYHVGLKFKKSGSWVVLAIFLPTVWLAIIGFGSAKWSPKKPLN